MNEYRFEEIKVGQQEVFSKKISTEMENAFREISGDYNPLHQDDDFAREMNNGAFSGHVSFGMLTASLYSTFAGMYMPGKYSLIHSFDELSFKKPVYAGDVLTVEGTVSEKNEALKLIIVKIKIVNQNKAVVSKAKMKILVLE